MVFLFHMHLKSICNVCTHSSTAARLPIKLLASSPCCTPLVPCKLQKHSTALPQVQQALSNSLEALLAAAFSQQSQGGTSLEMISILLQIGRPHHFESFEAFTKWRASFAATVSQSLILGAAGKGDQSTLSTLLRQAASIHIYHESTSY